MVELAEHPSESTRVKSVKKIINKTVCLFRGLGTIRHSFALLSPGLSLSTPSSSATPAPPPRPPFPILLSLSLPPLPPAPAPPLTGATGVGQGRVNGEKQRPRMRRGRVCFQVVAVSLQSEVKEIFVAVFVFFWFSCVHKH
jgi:hypothetical protein